jgi:hypothetical protein
MSERDKFRIDTDPEFLVPTPIGDRENDKQPKYGKRFSGQKSGSVSVPTSKP